MTATRRVDVGGLELAVLEAGQGGRPLLLVHGFTGAKEDFADHVEPLADEGWHVIAPDLRGHGESDHPTGRGAYALPAFAADVVALADALRWPRFTLLGHSLGGMVVQHIALEHAHRLVGLVLMGTSHAAPEGVDPDLVELGKAVVAAGGMASLVEAQRHVQGPFSSPARQRLVEARPEEGRRSERNTLVASAEMWLATVDEVLTAQPDRLDRLAALDVPTLVLVGEEDRSFLGPSRRLAATIPGARLVVIPDAGHCPQLETPDAWWEAVKRFLDEIAGAGSP